MPVIAMTREMGTLGKDVAAGLADELDLEVVHSEIMASRICKRLGITESAAYRHLEGCPTQWDRWNVGRRSFFQGTEQELIELALKDNVIIRGWGAVQVFNAIPHIACVRVCAPIDFRIQVMLKRLNGVAEEAAVPANRVPDFVKTLLFSSPSAVRCEIKQSDAQHATFVKRTFGTDWRDAMHYDLCLNTGRTSIPECIEQIKRLLQAPRFQDSDQARNLLAQRLMRTA